MNRRKLKMKEKSIAIVMVTFFFLLIERLRGKCCFKRLNFLEIFYTTELCAQIYQFFQNSRSLWCLAIGQIYYSKSVLCYLSKPNEKGIRMKCNPKHNYPWVSILFQFPLFLSDKLKTAAKIVLCSLQVKTIIFGKHF